MLRPAILLHRVVLDVRATRAGFRRAAVVIRVVRAGRIYGVVLPAPRILRADAAFDRLARPFAATVCDRVIAAFADAGELDDAPLEVAAGGLPAERGVATARLGRG